VVPEKLVKSAMDIPKWEKSEAYYDLIGFIGSISVAVQGTKLSQECEISFTVDKLLGVLKKLEKMAIETPPIDQPQRFGNSAFRTWFQKMQSVRTNA
jgi:serine/threonine-protein phosphatase 2A activator